jgi:hypothetical protein
VLALASCFQSDFSDGQSRLMEPASPSGKTQSWVPAVSSPAIFQPEF